MKAPSDSPKSLLLAYLEIIWLLYITIVPILINAFWIGNSKIYLIIETVLSRMWGVLFLYPLLFWFIRAQARVTLRDYPQMRKIATLLMDVIICVWVMVPLPPVTLHAGDCVALVGILKLLGVVCYYGRVISLLHGLHLSTQNSGN